MSELTDAIDAELERFRAKVKTLEAMRNLAEQLNTQPPRPEPKKRKVNKLEDAITSRKAAPVFADSNGSLEGKVLEAIGFKPETKSALAERFDADPKVIDKVLNKLRAEGEAEPGHARQGWRKV